MKPTITIKQLSFALLKSWKSDTAKGKWTELVPSLNQCAVTALVVQDYFGGDLMRCKLDDGDSHYWNRLPGGEEIDLTFEQFAVTKQCEVGEAIVRERSYVLSFPDTAARYERLCLRVQAQLRGK